MKRWYVVQVYAGYEQMAKEDLLKRIEKEHLQDLFGQVLVPTAKQKQYFSAVDEAQKDQQLFPGYVLVEMEMAPETVRLVNASHRVMRFLGGKEPMPIGKHEIDRILSQVKGEIALGPEKEEFIVNQEIEISEGPFAGFVAVVDKIDKENEKLTVMVSIFGRMTPLSLGV